MSSPPPSPTERPTLVSPNGLVHVLGYAPMEGERGVPITVRVHCNATVTDSMFVRIVIDNKVVLTKVRELPDMDYGRWQLEALAPAFEDLHSSTTKVPVTVQALNEDNAILDSLTFGEFSYWAHGTRGRRQSIASMGKLPRLLIPDAATLRRRASHNLPTPSPTLSDRSHPKSPKKGRHQRRIKSGTIVRAKQGNPSHSDSDDLYVHTPVLDMMTPLSSICEDWSSSEMAAGRRLVRFTKVQDGCKLIVSCESIPQEDYTESDTVISCIYRDATESYYVTSVDVIYLLERLTNGDFPVEEKNRIRRNLEGLRPTTVSKHKPGYSDFFQRIMEFPDPKPRNIEKDLKVFEWGLLGQALEKILSKYSIYTSGPNTRESTPLVTPTTAHSPDLYAHQLCYTPQEGLTPRFLDQQAVPKLESPVDFPSPADDFPVPKDLFDPRSCFPSPVDTHASISSPISSTYPYPDENGDLEDYGAPFDQFTTLGSYDYSEPAFTPATTSSFGYDHYANGTILDNETLAVLNEQYV